MPGMALALLYLATWLHVKAISPVHGVLGSGIVFVSEASFSFAKNFNPGVRREFHHLVIPSSPHRLQPVPHRAAVAGCPGCPGCHGAQHVPQGCPVGAGRPHSCSPWPWPCWAAVFHAGQWRQVAQLTYSKECHEHLGQSNWLKQVFRCVRCSPCVKKTDVSDVFPEVRKLV